MNAEKIKVAVLMGGPSAEHKVSLKSGRAVVKNIDKAKYETLAVKISPDNRWIFPKNKIFDEKTGVLELKRRKIKIVFPALHGEYGEDGTVQMILETAGVPFVGSGPLSSALGMNKAASAEILNLNRVKTPPFVVLNPSDGAIEIKKRIADKNLKYPLVVKPVNRGSSVGVAIIEKENQLERAVKKAEKYSRLVMIQKFIGGREITCGILEKSGEIISLPPTEIIPRKSKFFDYRAKYSVGGSSEITPADFPPETIGQIQKVAVQVHKIIGCSDFSRTDMILSKNGEIYVLEINTLPGLTELSLIPQEAKAAGISFAQFLDIVVQNAIKRHVNV